MTSGILFTSNCPRTRLLQENKLRKIKGDSKSSGQRKNLWVTAFISPDTHTPLRKDSQGVWEWERQLKRVRGGREEEPSRNHGNAASSSIRDHSISLQASTPKSTSGVLWNHGQLHCVPSTTSSGLVRSSLYSFGISEKPQELEQQEYLERVRVGTWKAGRLGWNFSREVVKHLDTTDKMPDV